MNKLIVEKWITYEEADEREDYVGCLGGMFQEGMRWDNYIERIHSKTSLPYTEALRQEILAKHYRFGGDRHQEDMVPLFSDGTVGKFSYRAWGDLMAAIWSTEENKEYCYMDFYMGDNL